MQGRIVNIQTIAILFICWFYELNCHSNRVDDATQGPVQSLYTSTMHDAANPCSVSS